MIRTKGLPLVAVSIILLGAAATWAYSSGARNSLLRSRDQVADQKYKLEQASNEISRKISDLQKQKYTIDQYLVDCDRTLRDLDRTLAAQDQAYRGR